GRGRDSSAPMDRLPRRCASTSSRIRSRRWQSRPTRRTIATCAASSFGRLRSLGKEELTDELLQHDGRLGMGDAPAIGEHLRIAPGIEPDVHLAQQTRRQDGGDRVLGELVAAVDVHGDERLVGLAIELDRLHPPDRHPRGFHGGPELETADILEVRFEAIAGRRADRREVADLEREKDDRADPDGDENADPEVDRGAIHTPSPRNMKTVSTKSSARMTSEEATTVRVVALETPSAV